MKATATVLFEGLDASTLAALLSLPYRVGNIQGGPGSHYTGYCAEVTVGALSDVRSLINGLIACVPTEVSHSPEDAIDDATIKASESEHTAPELDGQRVRVFTFGVGHYHPRTQQSLKGQFVRVPGDAVAARELVLAIFGRNFTTDYDPATAARLIAKYNMNEINPRPVLALDALGSGAVTCWQYHPNTSQSERRFKIVSELAEAAELEPVPAPDAEDAEAAMAAGRWNGPTQIIPTMSGGPT